MTVMASRIVHLQRKPHPGQLSMEAVFDSVREHLPEYQVDVVVSQHDNSGVLPRLKAVLAARRDQGDVTHVVGDVHFLVLLMRRRTTVLTIHDVEFLGRHPGLRGAVYRWLWVRLPVWRSAVVTVVSEATRKDVAALVGGDPARLRLVENPVRDHFTPSPLPSNAPPRVLLMGTWPNKNLERSVQALAGMEVEVDVTGPLDEAQRALLAPLRARNHVGLDDGQVVELLRRCDLLLFPSLSEGFGLPIVEAQASGRPVVTSDRSPMRDVAGGAACLVDPEDVASIRAGVLRVLDDRDYAQALVEAGLANVADYRADVVARAYAEIYAELLTVR